MPSTDADDPVANPTARPRRKTRVPRWRYVVPNAITCASLLVGLAAIMTAIDQHYVDAAWLVILSVLLDKLDGTAARLLNASTDIGVQLDSFADMMTFGVAPAFLVWAHLSQDAAGVGAIWAGPATYVVLAALMASYVLCAVIRLAKFNVLAEKLPADGPKVFYGMPTTFAGGLLATLYILAAKYELVDVLRWLPVVAAVFAALMVSNIPLPKAGKTSSMFLNVAQVVAALATYVLGLMRELPEVLFALVMIYAVGGFTWGIANRRALTPKQQLLDPYPE